MDHFTIPCAMHINTHGDLDIPEGAEIVVGDDGQYVGFIQDDGTQVPHRGFEANLAAFVDEPEVAATPAAVEHAEATGVDLTQVEGTGADGKITKADVVAAAQTPEETASGQTDGQQAG